MIFPSFVGAAAMAIAAGSGLAAVKPQMPSVPEALQLSRVDTSAAGAMTAASAPDTDERVRVTVDSAESQIVVTAGPFRLAASGGAHDMHGMEGMEGMKGMEGMENHALSHFMRFEWPVDGWLRGFTVDMVDASGKPLPGKLLHHVIGVNLDRRQLVYHAVERLFGWGSETDPVELPSSLAVPLKQGERLGMYAMFDNETGKDVTAYLRLTIPYELTEGNHLTAVLPLYVDVNNVVGEATTFDVPPGESEKSFEFEVPTSVKVIAVGGHLHDYGKSVRLEDAETGKVLVKLKAKRDDDGHVTGVGRFVFGFNTDALHLVANHKYRVVGEYDNPTNETIKDGGMAHINGAVIPDDRSDWPPLDPNDPLIKKDIASLPTGGVEQKTEVTSQGDGGP